MKSTTQVGHGILRLLIYAIIFVCTLEIAMIGIPATTKLDVKHFLDNEISEILEVL
jgi:hypothetical protein